MNFVVTLARKPTHGTLGGSVLEHGAGALHIEVSRIPTDDDLNGGAYAKRGSERHDGAENWRYKRQGGAGEFKQPRGRWPANVLLSEKPRPPDDDLGRYFMVLEG